MEAPPHQVITVRFVIHGIRNEFQVDPPEVLQLRWQQGCALVRSALTPVVQFASRLRFVGSLVSSLRTDVSVRAEYFRFPGRLIMSDHFVAASWIRRSCSRQSLDTTSLIQRAQIGRLTITRPHWGQRKHYESV